MSRGLAAARYSWRKLSAARWGDAWLERLSYLGPQRAMVVEIAGARAARVEAHGLTKAEGEALVKLFGGRLTEAKWLTAIDPPQRPPIRVRGRLLIFSTPRELEEHHVSGSRTPALLIPAGMAFGTGEHATTATCLRLLVDASRAQLAGAWDLLDLGTGSGILALAGRALGARSVEAGDFDPHAVRTAKQNVRTNAATRVRIRRLDVRQWEPDRRWPIICANLFSGLHLEIAPKFARAVAPGGTLIFSGILREQEAEVLTALGRIGFAIEKVVRKGKWVSGAAQLAQGKQ